MSIREIITDPHPTLRHRAKKVTHFDDELHTLLDDMTETMRDAPGVGLAAPQVNISKRVIVVEFGDDEDPEAPLMLYTLVNPQVTTFSDDLVIGIEGCLSIPDLVGEVQRPNAATIKGFDRYGEPLQFEAEGWLARIFQHEIDHLNGVLFTDHALRVWHPEDEENEPGLD
ncbi:MAG: peptide deformylase [Chloroflexi bacterium]|nr:peptide deformylase [Chloroflexota bacterium]